MSPNWPEARQWIDSHSRALAELAGDVEAAKRTRTCSVEILLVSTATVAKEQTLEEHIFSEIR